MKNILAILVAARLIGLAPGQHLRRRDLANQDREPDDSGMSQLAVLEDLQLLHEDDTTATIDPQLDAEGDKYNNSTEDKALEYPTVLHRMTASCPSFPGYVLWLGYDSYQYDLGRDSPSTVSLASMIASCSSNSNCKGLNTNGYYKSYIQPLRNWARWTTAAAPCQGIYIKTPTSMKVNGYTLNTKEVNYLKWIATWTVPNFGMSPYDAIRNYIGKGAWWALKEQVLTLSNAYNYTLCSTATGDKVIGPVQSCPSGRAWQVGIAAVQVPNYQQAAVEQRATSVYKLDIPTVLGRSAQQAGYSPGTATYNAIVAATGDVRKAWLLKAHVVGFYFVPTEVNNECLISAPKSWCYGTYGGTCIRCGIYAPDATSIQTRIDEVTLLLQSLTNGF